MTDARFSSFFPAWPEERDCVAAVARLRWGDKPVCPYCRSPDNVGPHREASNPAPRWQCSRCKKSFSATVKTFMHHSHADLRIWAWAAMKLAANEDFTEAVMDWLGGGGKPTYARLVTRLHEARLKRDPLFFGLARLAKEATRP